MTSNAAELIVGDSLDITLQPRDCTGTVGSPATFTVEANGTGLSYQWQVKRDGDWTDSTDAGASTATLSVEVTADKNGNQYRCIVTDVAGNEAPSSIATLTVGAVEEGPAITVQPRNYVGPVGGTATYTVEATGTEPLTYQWQYKASLGWKNSPATGAKTATVSIDITEAKNGNQYRCIVSNSFGSVTSNAATLTVGQFYTVTYDANEGVFGDGKTNHEVTVKAGEYRIDHEVPVKQGYAFGGWSVGNTPSQKINVTADVTVTAIWRPFYTVTYDANGGSWGTDENNQSITTRTEQAIGNKYYYLDTMNIPSRTGYVFLGWKIGTRVVEKKLIIGDTTATAQWAKAATVTYRANGGSWTDYQTNTTFDTYDITAAVGTYYIGFRMPDAPEGYQFDGWRVNGQSMEKVTLVEGAHIYVDAAWWKTVHVTYDPNGGAWGNSTQPRVREERTDPFFNVGTEWPQLDGYTFLGWADTDTVEDYSTVQTDYQYNLQADKTFYAIWYPDLKITYDANGGWLWYDDQGNLVTTMTDRAEYGRDYGIWGGHANRDMPYEFLGWTKDSNANENSPILKDSTKLYADTRLYAAYRQWTTVTYDANGGSWGPDETVRNDYQKRGRTYYVGIEEPHREGYEFAGWVDPDADGEDVVDFNDTPLVLNELNYTFSANWRRIVTVTYNPNGGSWNGDNTPRVYEERSGSYNVGEEWPQKDGCSFVGWAKTSTVADHSTVQADYETILDSKDENTTFYAIWHPLLTVTYDANGGKIDINGSQLDTKTVSAEYGHEFRVNNFWATRGPAYEFLGWTTDATPTVSSTLVGDTMQTFYADQTLKAVWKPLVTITYHGNGGTWGNEETKVEYRKQGRIYYVGQDLPYREGYQFDSWYDAASNGNDVNDTEIVLNDPNKLNYDFYAGWRKWITVTYVTSLGGWNDNGSMITSFTRDGLSGEYKVDGWRPYSDDQSKWFFGYTTVEGGTTVDYEPEDILTSENNVTLYAVWGNRPVVTYDANGGSWGKDENNAPITSQSHMVDPGYSYHVGWVEWGDPEHEEGYRFLGWSTDPNATEGISNGTETVINENTTFYAVWEDLVAVIYNPNGGSFRDGPEPQKRYFHYGEVINPTYWESPERPGADFDGWMDKDGEFPSLIEMTEDITLTAQWAHFVTYNANGGFWAGEGDTRTHREPEGSLYTIGEEPPVRQGYNFAGWTVDGECIGFIELDQNIEVIAEWEPDTSTVFFGWRWADMINGQPRQRTDDAPMSYVFMDYDTLCMGELVYGTMNDLKTVSFNDVTVSNTNILTVNRTLDGGFIEFLPTGIGSVTLGYKGMELRIESGIPGVAFSTSSSLTTDSYLGRWNYDGTENTIYLVAEDGAHLNRVTNQNENNLSIAVSQDGSYATITVNELFRNRINLRVTGTWGDGRPFDDVCGLQVIDSTYHLYWMTDSGPQRVIHAVPGDEIQGQLLYGTGVQMEAHELRALNVATDTVTAGNGLTLTANDFPHVTLTVGSNASGAPTLNYQGSTVTVMIELAEINETNFPDAKFHNFVSERYDANGDGFLSDEEVADVENMNLGGQTIGTVEGIRYFTNLRVLECPGNQGINLSDIKDLPIEIMRLNACQLTELSIIEDLEDLEELYLPGNNVSSLNISNNPNLRRLECHGNFRMTELDISNNDILKALVSSAEPSTQSFGENNEYTKIMYRGEGSYLSITEGMTITGPDLSVAIAFADDGATSKTYVLNPYASESPEVPVVNVNVIIKWATEEQLAGMTWQKSCDNVNWTDAESYEVGYNEYYDAYQVTGSVGSVVYYRLIVDNVISNTVSVSALYYWVEISSEQDGESYAGSVELAINSEVDQTGTSYTWYKSADGETWTVVASEGTEYSETLDEVGIWRYKLIVDNIESNVITVTITEGQRSLSMMRGGSTATPPEDSEEGNSDDGNISDGNTNDSITDDGNTNDGNTGDGNINDGNISDGNTNDGNINDGYTGGDTGEGNTGEGDTDDSNSDDGDSDDEDPDEDSGQGE